MTEFGKVASEMESVKPERPGCRIVRIPFDILGDILNTNAPVRIIPGNRWETKDGELWMVRCTNWPKDAVIVGCAVDFESSMLVVKIESPDFKRDPEGYAIPAIDLQYERIRVQEFIPEESPSSPTMVVEHGHVAQPYWKV